MIKLKIDGKEVQVAEGSSVLNAAEKLGISIPTMCYKEGYHCHPSCMVCLVKDVKSNRFHPSCALPAANGMDLLSEDDEVKLARREALELLLSDHVGDCEAPCRTACPAYMDIPLMNRLIAEDRFQEALEVVKEEIAIPHILGYICPAPCEKVCRRATIDETVNICQLKKFVAAEDLKSDQTYYPKKKDSTNKKVAIIGTGPAGLTAAFHLLKEGHECALFDKNELAGGSLRIQKMDKELPMEVLDSEIEYLKNYGADFNLNTVVDKEFLEQQLLVKCDAVILAVGSDPKINESFGDLELTKTGIKVNSLTHETNIPKVYACGSALKSSKMAVRSVAQAKATAYSVNQFLRGSESKGIQRAFNSRFGKLDQKEFEAYLSEAPNTGTEGTYVQLDPYQVKAAKKEAERCMHCDCRKKEDCKLRDHSDLYDADRKRFLLGDRCMVTKHFKRDIVVYEPEKCIKCGLCVEIAERNKEEFGFTHIGRGFDVRIKAPFGKNIEESLTSTAEECAHACPTAAISLVKKHEK